MEFSPRKLKHPEKVNPNVAGRSMPIPAIHWSSVQGTPLVDKRMTSRRFAKQTTEYPSGQPPFFDGGFSRILVRKSLLTHSPSMTTLYNLTNFCLRCFLAPLFGFYEAFQPAALVLRAQLATKLVANIGWTPAHPIHAPTLRPSA